MPARLTRGEWLKTPYARSEARDTDGAVRKLLAKYGVAAARVSEETTEDGRQLYEVRFTLDGRRYCVRRRGLDADASGTELLTQAKRALYHLLKALLENVTPEYPAEEALFAFAELADGTTLYEAMAPHMERLALASGAKLLPLLPGPRAAEGGAS